MKQIILLSLFVLTTKLSVFAQTRNIVYTPLGSEVFNSWTIDEYFNYTDKVQLSDTIRLRYPLATEINPPSATTTYNCHAYAWHIVENGSPIVWIGWDPVATGEDIYWGDGSYIEVASIIDGAKISYLGDHSAIVLSGTKCRSKWGAWPLCDHPVGYGPSVYKMYQRKYYSNLKMEGPTNICTANVVTYTCPPYVNCTYNWTYDTNMFNYVSGQGTNNFQLVPKNPLVLGQSWVKLTLTIGAPINKSREITKTILVGITASFTGNASVNYGGSGTWNATASGCTAPYHYQWWLREDLTPPVGAVMVGEEQSLTLMSVPRSAFAAETKQSSSMAVNTELSPSGPILRQPPTSTNYYLRLEAYDASGMRFDTQERLIIAYGNVDLINGLLRMPGSEAAQTSTLQMNISPNPAKDEATLEISGTEARSLENTKWQVELYDGAQMLKTKIQNIKGSKQTIRTAGWKEGVYIVRAKIGNDILTNKLVIKH